MNRKSKFVKKKTKAVLSFPQISRFEMINLSDFIEKHGQVIAED